MSRIILEPGNPFDFDGSGLDELARDLHAATRKQVEIVRRDERGYGVSLHEVIHVWIPWKGLEGAAAAQAMNIVVAWAKSRWKRDHQEHPDSAARPRTVIVWGPNNKPLTSVEIDSDGDEPEATERPVDVALARSRPARTRPDS